VEIASNLDVRENEFIDIQRTQPADEQVKIKEGESSADLDVGANTTRPGQVSSSCLIQLRLRALVDRQCKGMNF